VDKPLSEMTDQEIEDEILGLRERRAQARERRTIQQSEKSAPRVKKGPDEITGEAADILGDILGDLS
jgi:predicted ATPase